MDTCHKCRGRILSYRLLFLLSLRNKYQDEELVYRAVLFLTSPLTVSYRNAVSLNRLPSFLTQTPATFTTLAKLSMSMCRCVLHSELASRLPPPTASYKAGKASHGACSPPKMAVTSSMPRGQLRKLKVRVGVLHCDLCSVFFYDSKA